MTVTATPIGQLIPEHGAGHYRAAVNGFGVLTGQQ
jgi:hypothetical protein